MAGLLLDTLRGTSGSASGSASGSGRPIWLMRQAGRYLPEYRALRAAKGGFLELVHDSEAAAEVTLQPIRRFGFDGAILFSDILVIPHALGQDLAFLEGEGPHLSPPGSSGRWHGATVPERLNDLRRFGGVREKLDGNDLLGFAAASGRRHYAAGQGSPRPERGRTWLRDNAAGRDPARSPSSMVSSARSTRREPCNVRSWAGSRNLPKSSVGNRPTKHRQRGQHGIGVPVIGFPREGRKVTLTRVRRNRCARLDETIDHDGLRGRCRRSEVPGNLDRVAVAGGEELDIGSGDPRALPTGRTFNRGHGIDKEKPDHPGEACAKPCATGGDDAPLRA